ncbi:MAG: sodium/solute symporter [Acidobacteria bacterium]|nr:sodium/solute symporter [Acidobacteriota bacterium]
MNTFHPADLAVFVGYFAVFTAIAFWAGRKKKDDAADFFIQQNKLPWYAIGFSMIASGISSEQFIGTVGFAYSTGLSVANWEWANGPSMLILVFLFIPFYLRKKIVTMPHFLERRFDGRVRTLFAVLTILIYVFINLAGVLYSGGFALNRVFGINLYAAIWSIAILVAVFNIYGGMATLAWTNVFQASMLLGSGIVLSVIGVLSVPGGFAEVLGEGRRAHLILPASDPDVPWTALLVLMFSTNVWYYCTNQNINQSTLGARNKWHAQMGVILAALLWLIIPLADTFPGLVAYTLDPGLMADQAYFYVIGQLVPAGLRGLLFAVLCAAVVAAVQAGINGVSTVFTFDIFGRFVKDADQATLIRAGRLCSATALVIGAFWAPTVMRFEQIFSYFQECWAFVAVPVAATFVAGALWRRMNANAALVTLSLVFPMLAVPYLLRMFDVGMNAFNVAGLVAIATVALVVVLGFVTRPTGTEDDTMVFSFGGSKSDAVAGPLYRRVGFWAGVMMLVYAGVYACFW